MFEISYDENVTNQVEFNEKQTHWKFFHFGLRNEILFQIVVHRSNCCYDIFPVCEYFHRTALWWRHPIKANRWKANRTKCENDKTLEIQYIHLHHIHTNSDTRISAFGMILYTHRRTFGFSIFTSDKKKMPRIFHKESGPIYLVHMILDQKSFNHDRHKL